MQSDTRKQILELCREVLSPLIAADGGVLYVVSLEQESVTLHLGGVCSGCPGAPITTRSVIEPAVRSIAPSIKLTVTAGNRLPEAARPAPEFSLPE